jgi:hypothetical protein
MIKELKNMHFFLPKASDIKPPTAEPNSIPPKKLD